jgi:hypothetical protein
VAVGGTKADSEAGRADRTGPPGASRTSGEGIGVDQESWERALDVGWRRTATGVVVLPTTSTVAYALDGLPARCWEALGRPMGLDALADEVEIDGEQVGEVVLFLVAIGVVRACASSTT